MSMRIAVVVRRGSQVHQTPQVGRAQIEPSASVRAVNTAPASAADAASRSYRACRRTRYNTLKMKRTNAARNAHQAAGTCTYRIFWRWPMSRSGGDSVNPSTCAAATAARDSTARGPSQRAVGGCAVPAPPLPGRDISFPSVQLCGSTRERYAAPPSGQAAGTPARGMRVDDRGGGSYYWALMMRTSRPRLVFPLALLALAGCASRGPVPAEAARRSNARPAALARLTVENRTGHALTIAFRPAASSGAEVGVGEVASGADVEVAPVPAGEP